jgi:hypothetical protein
MIILSYVKIIVLQVIGIKEGGLDGEIIAGVYFYIKKGLQNEGL